MKYIAAYVVPVSAGFALYYLGIWTWITVFLIFGVLPIIELFSPQSEKNIAPDMEATRAADRFFDWLLYINLPMVYGIVIWFLWTISFTPLGVFEGAGLILSIGMVISINGINVAHELGHRSNKTEQSLSKILLLPTLYQHFFIEHNRGHHKNVATDFDPASAHKGEMLFTFWVRTIWGSWRGAWAIERERLAKMDKKIWTLENEMVRFVLFQSSYLALIAIFLGSKGVLGAIGIAVVSWLLLEATNYIEHYGLRRRKLENGHYEPVTPAHSWNSNSELGRIFLFELTRHSDHHYKSTRKYQNLRHMDESPQLPFGYPASILMALAPPLWFAVMNPRVEKADTARG